jgi:hypothetical protein
VEGVISWKGWPKKAEVDHEYRYGYHTEAVGGTDTVKAMPWGSGEHDAHARRGPLNGGSKPVRKTPNEDGAYAYIKYDGGVGGTRKPGQGGWR